MNTASFNNESFSSSIMVTSMVVAHDVNGDYFTYNLSSFIGSLAMGLLCLIGFYGNTVSVAIFSQPPMRSSINVLLSGISLIDLSVLLSSIPVFILPSLDQYLKFNFVANFYSFALLVVYPLAMMARTSSVWTFILISLERYFAVCYPLEATKMMTASRAKIAQVTVIVLSVFYNLIRFWEYEPNTLTTPHTKTADQVVPLLRSNHQYFVIYYTALYLITNFLAPFVLILILNTHILRSIRQAYDERQRLNGRQRHQYRTSHMIIVVTVMFGFCNIFAFVLAIWELCDTELFFGPKAENAYLLLDISNIAILFNSSTTFIVFLVYCSKYRRFFLWFFWCRCLSSKSARPRPEFFDPVHFRQPPSFLLRNYRTVKAEGDYSMICGPVTATDVLQMKSTVVMDVEKEMDALIPTRTPP